MLGLINTFLSGSQYSRASLPKVSAIYWLE